ncbi:light-harvesting protein [Jannaschia sp. CCS1]|uniref:light-harvesting protein n=1 Tax=Jannaschia sp. (strain CCS1) TaxID=290400 RepID=UPI000053D946|nr:light-harvesting protein [Jannaschia sp. CCS1]ABD54499.1 Peripheral light harvesting complex subunit [Jannaschia sp. CCS1]
MNNSKIWLVVKPTVGVPLFLSAVAVGSFAVHIAVLSKTNWYEDYLVGDTLGESAALSTDTQVIPASAVTGDTPLYLDAAADGGMLVTLPDGRTARLVIEDPITLASN